MKNKAPSYKKEYVRILTSGLKEKGDWNYARELIDEGYAEGSYQISRRLDTSGQITTLNWSGVNTNGRLFADELNEKIKKESWKNKIITLLIASCSFFAGIAVDVVKWWLSK